MYESIKELGIIEFLDLSIMWYSKEHNILETGVVFCRILDNGQHPKID
jgi:hypothetical protein